MYMFAFFQLSIESFYYIDCMIITRALHENSINAIVRSDHRFPRSHAK